MSTATAPTPGSVRAARTSPPVGRGECGAAVIPIERYRAARPGSPVVGGRPAVAGGPPGRPAPLRLTRRGRRLVRSSTGLVLLLVLAAGVLADRTALAGDEVRPVPVAERIVLPGETLWQIAGEVAPGADRRETVARLVELNGLASQALAAGQRIAVPVEAPAP